MMIDQLKRTGIVLLIGLAVVLLLAVMSDCASGGDCVVTRETTIQSERPIGLLVFEAGIGVLDGARSDSIIGQADGGLVGNARRIGRSVQTTLRIDGSPAPGIRGMARAGWRLLGFLVWDAEGSITRDTILSVHGHVVHVHDRIANGRVWVRVVVGPPLGDPRVRYAVLELEANENDVPRMGTRIRLDCAAVIDLPGDRCRLVRRLAERVADKEAGPPLRTRVDDLVAAGQRAIRSGRGELTESVIAEFLERVCR